MRVLIVDDSRSVRMSERNLLALLGHREVLEAEDGLDALKKLQEAQYQVDLIISDVNMPNLDGLGFVAQARAIPQLKSVPILMVTTEIGRETVQEAIKAGATSYLVKPFTPESFRQRLQQVLPPAAPDAPASRG